jgi:outer membrane protein assembly factor BamB
MPLRTLVCPTCGAPLDIKGNEPTIRCEYCNASIANPEYRPPQPVEPAAPIQIQIERPYPPPVSQTTSRAAKTSCAGISVIALALILLGVGGVVFFMTNTSGKIELPKVNLFPLQIHSPSLMIETDGGAPNLIAGTYDGSKSSYALSRLDLGSHKVVWSTLEQKDYLHIDALLAGDTYLYVVMETRLVALQLSDGQQAWEASLPDSLSGACQRCVLLQQGQVLVLTLDDNLGAYDAQTGHQTWEKRFDNLGYSLYPVQGGVAALYSMKNMNGAVLGVFDVSSGEEVNHIEPTCQPEDSLSDEMDVYSSIILDQSGQGEKAYIFFGFFNACVQRWDLSSGKLDWAYEESDQTPVVSRDHPPLLANGVLYYAQADQLRSLDAATGTQLQVLDENSDFSLIPLLVEGQRLLVRAKRTSGTTRFELWGYDLSAGKNLWKRSMLKGEPLDPPDEMVGLITNDESAWTYRLTSSGLWLIAFQANPDQVNLAQVNLDTGELADQKSVALGIDSSMDFIDIPERVENAGDQAWFVLENRIYAIDPEAGTFPYRWP